MSRACWNRCSSGEPFVEHGPRNKSPGIHAALLRKAPALGPRMLPGGDVSALPRCKGERIGGIAGVASRGFDAGSHGDRPQAMLIVIVAA